MADVGIGERQMALIAAFPFVCEALGDDVDTEFDRYVEQFPQPAHPFRNEEQLFALYLLQRYALRPHGDAVSAAVHADLIALRRRDPPLP